MDYPPNDVPAFVFWLMPDEDPKCEDWPHSTPLHAWQRGRCALCQPTDYFDNRLVMDHDHATGKIRGLVCRGCNISEGKSDSPKLTAWRSGLNPATILGIDEEYDYPFGYGQRMTEQMMREPISQDRLRAIAEAVATNDCD